MSVEANPPLDERISLEMNRVRSVQRKDKKQDSIYSIIRVPDTFNPPPSLPLPTSIPSLPLSPSWPKWTSVTSGSNYNGGGKIECGMDQNNIWLNEISIDLYIIIYWIYSRYTLLHDYR